MLSKLTCAALSLILCTGTGCKTTSSEKTPEKKVPTTVDEAKVNSVPSVHSKGPGDLVKPGADEVLISRGPGARCPSNFEGDVLEKVVIALGQETLDLVKEDIANLRQTMTRSDKDAVTSCCNQLEQMVQDVEIMNEDKPSAEANIEKIKTTTLKLCPSGS